MAPITAYCVAASFAAAATAFTPAPARVTSRWASAATSMAARRPLMAGNWKMNPTGLDTATELAKGIAGAISPDTPCDVAVFPPYPFIASAMAETAGSTVGVGAQSIFFEDEGAYTGAVSICQVKSMGCKYVLAGHSERRTVFKDDDTAINRKVAKIVDAGLVAVLCIGETLDEYEEGLVKEVCAVQLAKDLKGVTPEQMTSVVIAYEPVWAIGTGLVATPDQAQTVHKYIRSWVATKYGDAIADATIIQYGGSVTPDSVDTLMAEPDIDGCLVGGASLVVEKFERIINFKPL